MASQTNKAREAKRRAVLAVLVAHLGAAAAASAINRQLREWNDSDPSFARLNENRKHDLVYRHILGGAGINTPKLGSRAYRQRLRVRRQHSRRGDEIKTLKLTGAGLEPSEAKIQAMLLARLHALGYLAVRINSGAFRTQHGSWFRAYIVQNAPDESAGFPDILALRGCTDGSVEVRLFEIKRKNAKRTPEQLRFADFAAARGVSIQVVEGASGLEALEL